MNKLVEIWPYFPERIRYCKGDNEDRTIEIGYFMIINRDSDVGIALETELLDRCEEIKCNNAIFSIYTGTTDIHFWCIDSDIRIGSSMITTFKIKKED